VGLGEAREGAVRLVAEQVEAADDGQRAGPRRQAALPAVPEEAEEVDGSEGDEQPCQPREQHGRHC